MNLIHRWLCRSAGWRMTLERKILPWALNGVELGSDVLEVGPGPGLTTDLLRARIARMTLIEIDSALAESLRARLQDTNVNVIQGDATVMPFEDGRFSGAVCFTMLHHVPSRELQDKLLREVRRVLQPGGCFVGVDSLQTLGMRLIHIHDTLVPIDPDAFAARLEGAGFTAVEIESNASRFRFQARRAAA
jgi:ubiquinone/menaquinone biosynthesis C-methylase UbiE